MTEQVLKTDVELTSWTWEIKGVECGGRNIIKKYLEFF